MTWDRTRIETGDPFAGRLPVVVSPHYDDAAFSLGALLAGVRRGRLINCFTRSRYVARPGMAGIDDSIAGISALRDQEDAAFAATCGLERLSLGLDDSSARDRRPGDHSALHEDLAALRPALAAALAPVFAAPDAHALVLPAGLGAHVQHRATLMAGLSLLGRGMLPPVFFYEDLPYASRRLNRLVGLRRLKALVAGERPGATLTRLAIPVDNPADKLQLCALYGSQHRRPPAPSRFSPASFWPFPMHEALWRLETAGGRHG